jgi:hypothetical protein
MRVVQYVLCGPLERFCAFQHDYTNLAIERYKSSKKNISFVLAPVLKKKINGRYP